VQKEHLAFFLYVTLTINAAMRGWMCEVIFRLVLLIGKDADEWICKSKHLSIRASFKEIWEDVL